MRQFVSEKVASADGEEGDLGFDHTHVAIERWTSAAARP
jgi:hypothetical protein